MNIARVISFDGAWETLNKKHKSELEELLQGLANFLEGFVNLATDSERSSSREYFQKSLYDLGWSLNEKSVYTDAGRRVPVRFVGPLKNGVAAQISSPSPDFLTRWLFTHSTLAVRYGLAELPILLVPLREERNETSRNAYSHRMNSFEYYFDQLEMLSPLSLDHPFLILGYTNQNSLLEPSVTELEKNQSKAEKSNAIIDRSIEFPPEYQQAGIGILNYFASYLNLQYPNEDAKVKIEQDGLNVRMVVESKSGQKDIVEKALHEYEQIVSGKERAENLTSNERLILELRNELRVAKFRLESQQDIISVQKSNEARNQERIDTLMDLLGEGLKEGGRSYVDVQVNPHIQNSVSVEVNQDISLALGNINELIESLPKESEAHLPLKDLEQALVSVENEKDQDKIRQSAAMSKFARIIEEVNEEDSTIRKAVDAAEQGYEVLRTLAGNYNKIASWCGLPTVPEVFARRT